MIGLLRGDIVALSESELLIDTGAVGYRLRVGARLMSALSPGSQAVLHVETCMSDSAIVLYGFAGEEERAWFLRLQSVQGVGARVALAVLDALAPPDLGHAIALGDAAAIRRAKGVGRKLAERVVSELAGTADLPGAVSAVPGAELPESALSARAAALSALVNLGYGRSEAVRAVAQVARENPDERDEAQWVRLALRALAAS